MRSSDARALRDMHGVEASVPQQHQEQHYVLCTIPSGDLHVTGQCLHAHQQLTAGYKALDTLHHATIGMQSAVRWGAAVAGTLSHSGNWKSLNTRFATPGKAS